MPKDKVKDIETDEDTKWETERDLRTLMDVFEMVNDEKRLARVKKSIGTQKQALEAIEKIDADYLQDIGFAKK